MKKTFMKIILASVLILMFSLNAFALPSPETTGFIPEILSAVDANGNAIVVTLTPAEQSVIDEAMAADTLKKGVAFAGFYATVPEGTVFPITITFTVKGVTSTTTGYFLHWTGSVWEVVDAIFGTDTMSVTFNSLSPIVMVIDMDVTQIAVGTSPQTSDYLASVITILAVSTAIALVLSKKRSKA
ncbi:MAG: hypothetical protein ACYCWE_18805 [Eubacteriales bacterium]